MSVISLSGSVLGVLDAVLVGRPVDYARGERSAIGKASVRGPVEVGALGLAGDEQGDPVHHGGVNKAVHHYARDHYAFWRSELGDLPVLAAPGAFGENVSTTGFTEADVCLGDRLRVGTAVLRVSQGRRPCWKLGVRFGVPDMARRVLVTGRTGWYYAVEEPGLITAGDEIVVVERRFPQWPVTRLLHLVLRRGGTAADLREALTLPLPGSWRETLERRIDGGAAAGSGARPDAGGQDGPDADLPADEDWME